MKQFLWNAGIYPPPHFRWRKLSALLPLAAAWSVLLLHTGCSGPQSTASGSLPSSVMTRIHAGSLPAATLGFAVQGTGDSARLIGPRPGFTVPTNAITVPCSFESGLPTVQGRLNDRFTAPFILDTGAIFTSVSGRTAAQAGLRTVSTNDIPIRSVRGVAGTERSCVGLIDQLVVGTMEITNLYASVRLDEFDAGKAGLRRDHRNFNLLGLIPAIAGFSYVTIDYPGGAVTVSPWEEYRSIPSGARTPVVVPFVITNGSLQVTLGFPNGHRAEFVVDTGSNGELTLSMATVVSAGLRGDVERGRQAALVGVGGVSMEKSFTLNWIDAAGHRFAYVHATTGSRNTFNLIGSEWLRQFRVTFDFRRSLLHLEHAVSR